VRDFKDAKAHGRGILFIFLTKILFLLSKKNLQKCHPYIKAVVRLAEIGGARIGVDSGIDFADAGERMHNDSIFFHASEFFLSDRILSLCLGVFIDSITEALFLNTGLIDDITLRKNGGEIVRFFYGNVFLSEESENVTSHSYYTGSNKEKFFYRVVFGQEIAKGVNGSSIEKISYHGESDAIDRTDFVLDSEKVEEGLGGMLTGAVSGIDNRDRAYARSSLSTSGFAGCLRTIISA